MFDSWLGDGAEGGASGVPTVFWYDPYNYCVSNNTIIESKSIQSCLAAESLIKFAASVGFQPPNNKSS
jgi:hypothetical protein